MALGKKINKRDRTCHCIQAGQEAHSAELRSLQLKVKEERMASAQQLREQLNNSRGKAVLQWGKEMDKVPPVKVGNELCSTRHCYCFEHNLGENAKRLDRGHMGFFTCAAVSSVLKLET